MLALIWVILQVAVYAIGIGVILIVLLLGAIGVVGDKRSHDSKQKQHGNKEDNVAKEDGHGD
jgi:hypothetical protein